MVWILFWIWCGPRFQWFTFSIWVACLSFACCSTRWHYAFFLVLSMFSAHLKLSMKLILLLIYTVKESLLKGCILTRIIIIVLIMAVRVLLECFWALEHCEDNDRCSCQWLWKSSESANVSSSSIRICEEGTWLFAAEVMEMKLFSFPA